MEDYEVITVLKMTKTFFWSFASCSSCDVEYDPDFWRNILWMDKTSFKLNGRFIRLNYVYCTHVNLYEIL